MAGLPNKQVRVLKLHENTHGHTTLYRLEKGFVLHFILGPSLVDKNVRIFVNHPEERAAGPNRQLYREVAWENHSSSKLDVYDSFAAVHIVLSGSFNYFFTINGSDSIDEANGSGYFLVDPILTVGIDNEKLPMDCISCQTVLAKNLGTLDQWLGRLQVAKETSYNMLHFSPIQELGLSNSAYCIKDQLVLNPVFTPKGSVKKYTFSDVKKVVDLIHKEWEMLSITDLVFNHTANESPWIHEHPECSYNMVNSPHLKPAYLLDRIMWHFSLEIGEGCWRNKGIPPEISNEDHLSALKHAFEHEIMPKHKLHEYYCMHIDDVMNEFRVAVLNKQEGCGDDTDELCVIDHPKFMRLRASVNIPLAVKIYWHKMDYGQVSHEERVERACGAFRERLQQLNDQRYYELLSHLGAATENFVANARCRFVNPEGEKLGKVGPEEPIQWNYFTLPTTEMTVEQEEVAMHSNAGAFIMAHNGWVMGDDPMRNFAAPGSNVYLRRELIPWGDSVKLRYGSGPADCPFLWQHMAEYATQTAQMFHGVRLDNCHSTPIHVAEYMLDEARKVRPDLYIIAELFTNDTNKDNIFINRLGLNSLIREALKAENAPELADYVHENGGLAVGAFIQPPARRLSPTVAHAIMFDQTHDEKSPVQLRTALDMLPNAAMCAMACCASGSNRGYDEMVPEHINVVKEKRLYQTWVENSKTTPGQVNIKTGLLNAKKALNKLHHLLGNTNYNQIYVDKVNDHVVSLTRHNQVNHQSVIMVVNTAFRTPANMDTGFITPLCVTGVVDEIVLEARLSPKPGEQPFIKDDKYINGLSSYQLHLDEHIKLEQSRMVALKEDSDKTDLLEIDFRDFPPGSIIAFKVNMTGPMKENILKLRQTLSLFGYRMNTLSARKLSDISSTEIEGITAALSLSDINRVLYRCPAEEEADEGSAGAYDLPGHGRLTYCGLQGVMCLLNKIRPHNELGGALCNNLRDGDWLMHYISKRLERFEGTAQLGKWFSRAFAPLGGIPHYLVPSYFDAIITGVYMLVEEIAWAKMSPFVATGASFVRVLAMGSIQFCSYVPDALLPPLSPMLQPPYPPSQAKDGKEQQACLALAAGLPHFASGIFRNWGRDTFIALRGLLLLPGRFQEARYLILGYAGTLRHGLIPNLLGSGVAARYNCRDAVWWWLECIHQYIMEAPGGKELLNDRVARMYPFDDTTDIPEPGTADQPLHQVIQEALQRHATGLSYRERNAGRGIDNDMSDQGFNVTIGVDWKTGFVYGGNEHNCGTWMDKMGSSDHAGNKGRPATPRDGSAIELVGLCMSTLQMLDKLNKSADYPYDGVLKDATTKITWRQWSDLIQANFEKYFWISTNPAQNARPQLVNKTGIYKDCHGATQDWTDYQLRPNQVVTMVVAPELFTAENAWHALAVIEEHLMGPLGMKTLDPSDWKYCGDYINSNDSGDFNVARGFNYHNGPEWLWPVGYFLRAKLHYAAVLEKQRKQPLVDETIAYIKHTLSKHRVHVMKSDWRSLPELTNTNGNVCHDSCEAQAWSVGCLLELLYDMEKFAAQKPK